MKRTTVIINSANKTSGSVNDFKISLPPARTLKNVRSIEVHNIELPFSWYPITSANNTIAFTDDIPNDYTCTITPGNYTGDELASEIQTKMSAELAGFTVTYNPKTLKFTIANGSDDFELIYTTTTASKLIGLDEDSGVVATWTSDNIINLSGTNHVYLISHKLSQGRDQAIVDNTLKDIFIRIPVDEGFGNVIRYKTEASQTATIQYQNNFNITEIDFSLVDEDFVALDLNGLNYTVELWVYSDQD
jgi:hypothetical protein